MLKKSKNIRRDIIWQESNINMSVRLLKISVLGNTTNEKKSLSQVLVTCHVLVRNKLTFNSNTFHDNDHFKDLWEFCIMLCTSSQSLYIHAFKFIRFIVLMICPGQSSKCKNKTGNNLQYGKEKVTVLLSGIYLHTKVQCNSFYNSQEDVQGKDKITKGKNSKIREGRVMVICTALLFNSCWYLLWFKSYI